MIGRATAQSPFQQNSPEPPGGIDDVGGRGVAEEANDKHHQGGLKANHDRPAKSTGPRRHRKKGAGLSFSEKFRDKKQGGEHDEGGKHERLEPTHSQHLGETLHGDVGETKKEGGQQGPSGRGTIERRPLFFSVKNARRKGKKGHGQGGEDGSRHQARANGFLKKHHGE